MDSKPDLSVKVKPPEEIPPGAVTVQPTRSQVLAEAQRNAPFRVSELAQLTEDTPLALCPHNLDLAKDGMLTLLFDMGGKGHLPVENGKEVRVRMKYYLIRPDVSVDEETGEVTAFLRTTISDGNGRTVSSSSDTLYKRLKQLLMNFGGTVPASGLPIAIVDRNSRNPGRHYHDIRILKEGEECP